LTACETALDFDEVVAEGLELELVVEVELVLEEEGAADAEADAAGVFVAGGILEVRVTP